MAKKKSKSKVNDNTIVLNKKARHDYFIEDQYEAGLVLEGWEVKSLRSKKVQINESYVMLKNHEAWLLGAHITPLATASTHIHPAPVRARKLLFNGKELGKLVGLVERKGYTLVALAMYWKQGRAKLKVGLAKGKKDYDKRAVERDNDWKRQKARLLKGG